MARSRHQVEKILAAFLDDELDLPTATDRILSWAEGHQVEALKSARDCVCPQCQGLLRLSGIVKEREP